MSTHNIVLFLYLVVLRIPICQLGNIIFCWHQISWHTHSSIKHIWNGWKDRGQSSFGNVEFTFQSIVKDTNWEWTTPWLVSIDKFISSSSSSNRRWKVTPPWLPFNSFCCSATSSFWDGHLDTILLPYLFVHVINYFFNEMANSCQFLYNGRIIQWMIKNS